MDEGTPLFVQIADQLVRDIVDGTFAPGDRVPSTNELAAFHRINPATAAKGINLLVERGLLHKRRGLGMFVSDGAKERLIAERRTDFERQYVEPLIAEAKRLGITHAELVDLIRQGADGP